MTDSAVVALVQCGSYDEEEVNRAIKEAVALLGGWGAFLQPEDHILLKPNLLRKAAPHEAVTTHPAIMKAVALLLREAGYAHISYGDSPGGSSMESVARAAGLAQVAEEIGLPAADFNRSSAVPFEGVNFTLCKGPQEADAIVNLPKMKTHALERITGAVKNLYGCVHGAQKAAGHTQYPDAASFAGMLTKLERVLKPKLHIMDGVVAMEGNGPASGDPVKMGIILASADPYALDQVYCRLIALDPALVPTNNYKPGADAVIRTPQGDITWGEALRRYGKKDFRVDRSGSETRDVQAKFRVLKTMQRRPVLLKEQCQSCGVCADSCPLSGKALKMEGEYPVFNYSTCIRCYCCQEMCPHQAIEPRQPLAGRLLAGKWRG